jgi:hypothetical protein
MSIMAQGLVISAWYFLHEAALQRDCRQTLCSLARRGFVTPTSFWTEGLAVWK